jgi:hypothetical protein
MLQAKSIESIISDEMHMCEPYLLDMVVGCHGLAEALVEDLIAARNVELLQSYTFRNNRAKTARTDISIRQVERHQALAVVRQGTASSVTNVLATRDVEKAKALERLYTLGSLIIGNTPIQ